METITCTKCSKEVEVEKLQGDYSTFVCRECQEAINQPAYKAELAELKGKEERTESEDRRIEYLKAKMSSKTPAVPAED